MSKVLVLGLGKSGVAVLDYFFDRHETVYAYDTNEKMDTSKFKKYENSNNIQIILGKNPTGDEDVDIVYISPGITPHDDYVKKFIQRGIQVTGEIELAYNISESGNFIGITGTNGKTTTTSIIGDIYKKYDKNSYIVGNIGNVLLTGVRNSKPKSNFITELSSFQLETIKDFKPHIAVILNISKDHLERHKTIENYKNAKYNIAKNQTKDDFLVLNKDDENIDIDLSKIKSKVVYFSMKKQLSNGVYYDIDKKVVISTLSGEKEEIIKREDIHLLGNHNVENVLASIAVAILDNIPVDIIIEAIKEFKPVKHRLQKVRTVNGVIYVNDSKGTNPQSTIKAINALDGQIILIAGGYDKMIDFDDLVKELKGKVRRLILFGATKRQIRDTALEYGYKKFIVLDNLKQCVQVAQIVAKKGDYVLLSPACASWDMYENFEERGDEFIEIVKGLK